VALGLPLGEELGLVVVGPSEGALLGLLLGLALSDVLGLALGEVLGL